MSIQAVQAYRVGQQVFPTIQEAQKQELSTLLSDGGVINDAGQAMLDNIIKHTGQVVAILTCQPNSKPQRKPRSDLGHKRKPKSPSPLLPTPCEVIG